MRASAKYPTMPGNGWLIRFKYSMETLEEIKPLTSDAFYDALKAHLNLRRSPSGSGGPNLKQLYFKYNAMKSGCVCCLLKFVQDFVFVGKALLSTSTHINIPLNSSLLP